MHTLCARTGARHLFLIYMKAAGQGCFPESFVAAGSDGTATELLTLRPCPSSCERETRESSSLLYIYICIRDSPTLCLSPVLLLSSLVFA